MINKYELNIYKLINILILLLCLLSPFEVSCISSLRLFVRLLLVFIALISIIYIIINKKIEVTNQRFLLFVLFVIPAFLSFIGMTYVELFNPNGFYFDNALLDTCGRSINYISLALFIYIAFSLKKYYFYKNFDNEAIIKYYWLGCFIAILFCLWQFISMYTGLIPFPFDTRDYIHSVGDNMKKLLPGRLTGISSEPSYIVPVIYDFIILSYIYFNNNLKRIFVFLGLFCLFFTLSGSACFEFVLLTICFYSYMTLSFFSNLRKKVTFKSMLIWGILTIIIVSSFILFNYLNNGIIALFLTRLINVTGSGRFRTFVLPFIVSVNSNFVNMLFGHGVKSFILLANFFNEDITSNSLYPDIFWEHGLIGLFGILLYIFLILKSIIFKQLTPRRNMIILFITHFLIASFYRSDFASTRSFIIIMIITILYEKERVRSCFISNYYNPKETIKNYTMINKKES